MRSFIIALIILVLSTAFIIVNAFVISGRCEKISSSLREKDTEKAYELWEEYEDYLSVFIHHRTLDIIDEEAENMHAYYGRATRRRPRPPASGCSPHSTSSGAEKSRHFITSSLLTFEREKYIIFCGGSDTQFVRVLVFRLPECIFAALY